VFEKRVLGRMFGPKRDEVTGEWRNLHTEELNDVYCSPNTLRVIKSRRMRWAGHVLHMGEGRSVYMVLVGKPEGKSPMGRPRCRPVQPGFGTHLDSCRMGAWALPGVKHLWHGTEHPHTLCACMACDKETFTFTFIHLLFQNENYLSLNAECRYVLHVLLHRSAV
jgi:hypothetical protein